MEECRNIGIMYKIQLKYKMENGYKILLKYFLNFTYHV